MVRKWAASVDIFSNSRDFSTSALTSCQPMRPPRAELQRLGRIATALNVSIPDMLAAAAASFGEILAKSGSAAIVLTGYRASLGLPHLPQLPDAPVHDTDDFSSSQTAVFISVPIGVSLLLAVAAAFVWHRRRGRLPHLGGQKSVPGSGPGTTLLVSDIEGR